MKRYYLYDDENTFLYIGKFASKGSAVKHILDTGAATTKNTVEISGHVYVKRLLTYEQFRTQRSLLTHPIVKFL